MGNRFFLDCATAVLTGSFHPHAHGGASSQGTADCRRNPSISVDSGTNTPSRDTEHISRTASASSVGSIKSPEHRGKTQWFGQQSASSLTGIVEADSAESQVASALQRLQTSSDFASSSPGSSGDEGDGAGGGETRGCPTPVKPRASTTDAVACETNERE